MAVKTKRQLAFEHKVRRLVLNGDVKSLARLKDQLCAELEILKAEAAEAARPKFRKSYNFEAWCDALVVGRMNKSVCKNFLYEVRFLI